MGVDRDPVLGLAMGCGSMLAGLLHVWSARRWAWMSLKAVWRVSRSLASEECGCSGGGGAQWGSGHSLLLLLVPEGSSTGSTVSEWVHDAGTTGLQRRMRHNPLVEWAG
jgi:hypothetical protein